VNSAKKICVPVLALCIVSITLATKYAGDFEELGTSARAIGMGGCVVASATGPAAIYYNPAMAGRAKHTRALFLHSEDFSGLVHHNFLGVSFPSGLQSYGLGLLHNGIPGIKLTKLKYPDKPGPNDSNPPVIDRVVSVNQFVGYINYARAISPHVAFGGNTKIIYQDLGVGSCFGMGIDFGLALTPGADIDVGLRVRNASTSPLFWTTGTRELILPRVALGFSKTFRFGKNAIGLAFEAEANSEESDLFQSFGVEYSFRKVLFVRLGTLRNNFTFGLGGRYKRFYIDYGYTSGYMPGAHGLGSAQQVSGGVEF